MAEVASRKRARVFLRAVCLEALSEVRSSDLLTSQVLRLRLSVPSTMHVGESRRASSKTPRARDSITTVS